MNLIRMCVNHSVIFYRKYSLYEERTNITIGHRENQRKNITDRNKQLNTLKYDTWGSHSSADKDSSLLWCDTVLQVCVAYVPENQNLQD